MTYILTTAFLWILASLLFLLLRISPIWEKRNQGCDTYNILLCAEALRRDKKLPICLPPLFILEEQVQWYPPGFLILCALIPESWLKRRFWLVNHLIDLLHISLAYFILAANGMAVPGAIAMLLYAILAPLILEFSSLNTRPLGLLLFSAFMLSAYAGMISPVWTILAGVSGTLLFYSHKLSMQQLWLTLPLLAVATGDWRWFAWLPAIYVLSWLVWPRGFRNIFSGHLAIIRFWSRNWPNLGAHAVRQSPVYGDGKTRTDFYSIDGLLGVCRLARDAFYQNPFILVVLVTVITRPVIDQMELFLLAWTGSAYLLAFLVHVIPGLRGIGLGRQYIKFAILPTVLLLVPVIDLTWGGWTPVLFWLCAAVVIYRYLLVFSSMRAQSLSQSGVVTDDLRKILDLLREEESPRVLCLPVHLCDLVAYEARIPVYWGTHSHCFDQRLENFFPVLNFPLQHYLKEASLTHILIDSRYVSPKELSLPSCDIVIASNDFILYRYLGTDNNNYKSYETDNYREATA